MLPCSLKQHMGRKHTFSLYLQYGNYPRDPAKKQG
jgi:hypothetical protein